MIVRILGEGQLDVPDTALAELDLLDAALMDSCEADDPVAFDVAMAALLDRVRSLGTAVVTDVLGPSDLVLPTADASLAEVKELVTEEGLIRG